MQAPTVTNDQGKVQFTFYWRGSRQTNGWQISVLDIFMKNVTTEISAKIPDTIDEREFTQLKFRIRENSGNEIKDFYSERVSESISFPPETAETMRMKARIVQTYENKNMATMDPVTGKVTYELRDRRKDLTVAIDQIPKFKAGEQYEIQVEPKGDQLRASFCTRNVHFIDLILEFEKGYENALKVSQETMNTKEIAEEAHTKIVQSVMESCATSWVKKFSSAEFLRLEKEGSNIEYLRTTDVDKSFLRLALVSGMVGSLHLLGLVKGSNEVSEAIQQALQQNDVETAMHLADSYKNENKNFLFMMIADECIERNMLTSAKIALKKIPSDVEGKSELLTKYREKKDLMTPSEGSATNNPEKETKAQVAKAGETSKPQPKKEPVCLVS